VKDKSKKKKKKKKKSSAWSTVILVLILLIGAGIMAYPTVSDWWNSFHQTRAIANYATAVEEMDTEVLEAMLEDARRYNAALVGNAGRYEMDEDEREEYESLLNLSGDGVMGYISIPNIGVNLPIYHGTGEAVLQIAVGHIEGTSLPVGGAGTHAALSGHRGLPSARLFTDLDQVEEGDVFVLSILGEQLAYEIDQIRIVEPWDMSDLNIISGEDHCTLITCTPYGVNTHRLLVRGRRIENTEEKKVVIVTANGVRVPTYVTIPAVGIPLLFMFLLGMLIYYRRKPKPVNEEEVLRSLEERDADE